MAENPLSNSDYSKFLFEEYRLLTNLRENASKRSESRVNVFFALVTVIVGGGVWINKNPPSNNYFFTALIILNILLLLIGLSSFLRLLESHVSIVTYTRDINRIRGFFLKISNGSGMVLKDALSLPPFDNQPDYGGFGFGNGKVSVLGLTWLIMILNSFLVGTLSGLLLYLFTDFPDFFIIGLSVILIAIFEGLLIWKSNKRFKKAKSAYSPLYIEPQETISEEESS